MILMQDFFKRYFPLTRISKSRDWPNNGIISGNATVGRWCTNFFRVSFHACIPGFVFEMEMVGLMEMNLQIKF